MIFHRKVLLLLRENDTITYKFCNCKTHYNRSSPV